MVVLFSHWIIIYMRNKSSTCICSSCIKCNKVNSVIPLKKGGEKHENTFNGAGCHGMCDSWNDRYGIGNWQAIFCGKQKEHAVAYSCAACHGIGDSRNGCFR